MCWPNKFPFSSLINNFYGLVTSTPIAISEKKIVEQIFRKIIWNSWNEKIQILCLKVFASCLLHNLTFRKNRKFRFHPYHAFNWTGKIDKWCFWHIATFFGIIEVTNDWFTRWMSDLGRNCRNFWKMGTNDLTSSSRLTQNQVLCLVHEYSSSPFHKHDSHFWWDMIMDVHNAYFSCKNYKIYAKPLRKTPTENQISMRKIHRSNSNAKIRIIQSLLDYGTFFFCSTIIQSKTLKYS